MLHPIEFLRFMVPARQNQRLMARIGLNALYDADAYPVDLSELDKLSSLNRTIVAGFLNWCALRKNEKYSWCDDEVRDLISMANAAPKAGHSGASDPSA